MHRYIDEFAVRAQQTPNAPALLAISRPPLTFARLWEHLERIGGELNAMSLGRGDRVAMVLPNGPEMATGFLAVAAVAVCAPLNPAYAEREFEFYLADLSAKALIVQAGLDSPALAVAQARGIRILELLPALDDVAGIFHLGGAGSALASPGCFAEADEAALVLHTSGTTSRPKIVPLTHANLCISAHSVAGSLQLSPADRCLNIMPLFHIHGLIGALLSSLSAGGSVVCSPGFRSDSFCDWVREFEPTWYTAVPTIHQTIARLAADDTQFRADHRLRFIRSCSSALPPKVMADLEAVFHISVVEAYGMTEAAHQMASNPMPPRRRKPGSVGVAAGSEVAIMDELGNFLRPGQTGEIVIRGPNVMAGYENNPAANVCAFTNGWFRTGDRGSMDAEGYITIVGRIKEMINRGGEKISPREIDEVLLEHPAIAQALAFAIPHPTLGEDVAAAVVLREGAAAGTRDLQDFAAAKLAPFKVPRRIVVVKEIPKGPTGKPQRIGLAEKLDVAAAAEEFVAPRTALEAALAASWCEILGVEKVGVHDDFFDLGGDSIMATQVLSRLRDAAQVEIAIADFFDHPTIADIAGAGARHGCRCSPLIQR